MTTIEELRNDIKEYEKKVEQQETFKCFVCDRLIIRKSEDAANCVS